MDDERKTKIGGRRVRLARQLPTRPTVHPDFAPGRRTPVPVEDDGPKEPIATYTVERGRTVIQSVPGTKRLIGHDPDSGSPVFALEEKAYGPGSTVSMPVSEGRRLQGLGFLQSPDRRYPAGPSTSLDHTVEQKLPPQPGPQERPRRERLGD